MPRAASQQRRAARVLAVAAGSAAYVWWWTTPWLTTPPAALAAGWLAALLFWALALFSPWPIRRPNRITLAAACIIGVLTIPRAVSLSQAPYAITNDEILPALYGLDMLKENFWALIVGRSDFFFIPLLGAPYLTQLLQAWPAVFFEPLLSARLGSLLLSVVSLAGTYALAGRLFGGPTALIAVTLLAASHWHMAYSRLAYTIMQTMAVVPWALHVLVMGIEERNRSLQFLAGVLLALSLLVYTPARIVVPIAAVWLVHRLITSRPRWRDAGLIMLTIACGFAMFASPYFRTQQPETTVARFHDVALGEHSPWHLLNTNGWTSSAGRELLATQIRAATEVYYVGGAQYGPHDFFPRALLDPVSLALCVVGICLCVVRPRDGNRFLLILWIGATFVFGQVLTDVPTAAYRAGPLLPALAICGALAVVTLSSLTLGWGGKWRRSVLAVCAAAALAVVLRWNLCALNEALAQRSRDAVAGMARLIAAGPRDAAYYLVTFQPSADAPVFRMLDRGRSVHDLRNLMDLGTEFDPQRPAVIVIEPELASALEPIQRCYPAGALLHEPFVSLEAPVLGLALSREMIAAGRHCSAPLAGPGLRARYFSGASWDGTVILERIEDWPVRFAQDPERFRSIEWSGRLRVPVSGDYRFQLLTNGGMSDATVGSMPTLHSGEAVSGHLDAETQPLTLRCRTERADDYCILRWAPPGGTFALIPSQFLAPPS